MNTPIVITLVVATFATIVLCYFAVWGVRHRKPYSVGEEIMVTVCIVVVIVMELVGVICIFPSAPARDTPLPQQTSDIRYTMEPIPDGKDIYHMRLRSK